jgi:hypothetical protein
MMRTLYTISFTIAGMLLVGCSQMTTVDPSVFRLFGSGDPRCTPNQYCPYTDPTSPIRTTVLKS